MRRSLERSQQLLDVDQRHDDAGDDLDVVAAGHDAAEVEDESPESLVDRSKRSWRSCRAADGPPTTILILRSASVMA